MCALHVPEEPTGEEEVGILGFATATPGIRGKLRAAPEDFVVVEESVPPPERPGGPITAAVLRVRNWETNRLVRRIARRLRMSSRRIRFAGLKDKRAVTTQLMTLEAPLEAVAALRLPDVEVLSTFSTDEHVSLGDLVTNSFEIAVTGPDGTEDEVSHRTSAVQEAIDGIGGFPNFYGVQRFGVHRPVSHLVGRELVRGDVDSASWTYLTHVGPGEDEASATARRELDGTRDVRAALRSFPETLGHERVMLDHLLHNPGDHAGALSRLPFNLQLMLVHAYQGLLFNRILSERLRRELPLNAPVEGDMLVPVDERGLADHGRYVRVGKRNLAKAELQVRRGRALVSGLVLGTEAPVAEGEMGDIEAAVLDAEGLEPGHFRIPRITELTSPGIRRELAMVGVTTVRRVEAGRATFSFPLPKGCYATTVLREFMKSPMLSY